CLRQSFFRNSFAGPDANSCATSATSLLAHTTWAIAHTAISTIFPQLRSQKYIWVATHPNRMKVALRASYGSIRMPPRSQRRHGIYTRTCCADSEVSQPSSSGITTCRHSRHCCKRPQTPRGYYREQTSGGQIPGEASRNIQSEGQYDNTR